MLSESITAIHGGCIGTAHYDEVVLSTYTGWVIGLTSEPQQKQVGMTNESINEDKNAMAAKISTLRLV